MALTGPEGTPASTEAKGQTADRGRPGQRQSSSFHSIQTTKTCRLQKKGKIDAVAEDKIHATRCRNVCRYFLLQGQRPIKAAREAHPEPLGRYPSATDVSFRHLGVGKAARLQRAGSEFKGPERSLGTQQGREQQRRLRTLAFWP